MPYIPFQELFPEIAEKETRSIKVFDEEDRGLPCAEYGLVEMFCDEPDCDCRRVFLCIFSSLTKKPEAYIAFGWESLEFYAKWLGDDDPKVMKELKGPSLNLGSPQSDNASSLLKLVTNRVLDDKYYVQRLQTHYWMFRQKLMENKRSFWIKISEGKQKRIGGLPPRHTFVLNLYSDARFSQCPMCHGTMNMRKFALFIHVDSWGPLSLGKTCHYCPRCELIIAHQDDLEHELCICFDRLSPEVIGRKYFVLGTVALPVWKKGLSVKTTTLQETLAHVA